MNENINRKLIESYFATLTSGGDIGTFFSDDIVWQLPRSNPLGDRFVGRDSVLEMFGKAVGLFDPSSLSIELQALVADSEHAVARFVLRGLTAAGAPYENDYQFFFACRDGRITAVWEMLDTLHQARTGLLTDTASAGDDQRQL